MCVARNMIKNPKLVPGGGATEMAISASLKAKSSFVEGVDKVRIEGGGFLARLSDFLACVFILLP